MAILTSTIDVAKSNPETKKREKIGEVTIYIPDLAEFGITAETKEVVDGLPVYSKESDNFLFAAVVAAAKADARNKLLPASTTLRDGAKIAETLAELMEAGKGGGGNPEALKAIAELKRKWAAHVAKLGKSKKAQDLLVTLFGNKQALSLQAEENRAKFVGYLEEFAASLPEINTYEERYLTSLNELAKAEEAEADDF